MKRALMGLLVTSVLALGAGTAQAQYYTGYANYGTALGYGYPTYVTPGYGYSTMYPYYSYNNYSYSLPSYSYYGYYPPSNYTGWWYPRYGYGYLQGPVFNARAFGFANPF